MPMSESENQIRLVPCPKCKVLVASDAQFCPNCGATLEAYWSGRAVLLGCFGVLFSLCGACWGVMGVGPKGVYDWSFVLTGVLFLALGIMLLVIMLRRPGR